MLAEVLRFQLHYIEYERWLSEVVLMDYVEWCELVMSKLDAESDRNDYVRNNGIDTGQMEKLVWENDYDEVKDYLNKNNYQPCVRL